MSFNQRATLGRSELHSCTKNARHTLAKYQVFYDTFNTDNPDTFRNPPKGEKRIQSPTSVPSPKNKMENSLDPASGKR